MERKYLSEIKFFQDLQNRHRASIQSDIQRLSAACPSPCHLAGENIVDPSSDSIISTLKVPDASIQAVKVKRFPQKAFKKLTWGQDSYEGSVLVDNLHGSGYYFTQKNGEKYFYDGLFYMNKLEGYCQVFYENGTHFQGLFKEHVRYGPGILSYPDGTQDVGFWNGFKLARLACVVELLPALASTRFGKTRLLCNRYVVPLYSENDKIKNTTTESNKALSESILDQVLNVHIRNPNSQFFHKKFYDEQFFGGRDCTIKVLVDNDDGGDDTVPEEAEEVAKNASDRANNLRSKIEEVNESLQTYIVIKRNISQRLERCKLCCAPISSKEVCQTAGEEKAEINSTEKNGTEDVYIPFDGSLESLEIIQAFESIPAENTSQSTIISDVVEEVACICEDDPTEDLSGDLQSLEEQLRNVSIQERYYRNIRDELQKKLDRIVERDTNKQGDLKFKVVTANQLWAWNNEDSLIQMQKHCFKHRNSEDMVNFSVSKLILGNRKEFGATGKHEDVCKSFLSACSRGDVDFVTQCLRNNMVNPNIADLKGNTGVFYASVNNNPDVISVLRNFGAKLDQVNDEHLTPLSMCLLKYISRKNNCADWETAFLPQTSMCQVPDLPKWYDVKSFPNVDSQSKQSSDNAVFRSSTVKPITTEKRGSSSVKEKKASISSPFVSYSYMFDFSCEHQKIPKSTEVESSGVEADLGPIRSTILTLLNCGASSNACEVPFPPLVLSLLTENPDLVKEVLKAKADLNVLIENGISCLHIAASLKPSQSNINVLAMLAKYGCNPNHVTLPSHWEGRRSAYTGNLPGHFEIEDFGKNALHLLCMRTDFEADQSDYFCSVAKRLLESDIDTRCNYLGHTPLSLAVLSGMISPSNPISMNSLYVKMYSYTEMQITPFDLIQKLRLRDILCGYFLTSQWSPQKVSNLNHLVQCARNIKLAQCLIKSNAFDPYKALDYGMGNILTLYTLKRFENTLLPIEQCKAMLAALFEINVNVLNAVGSSENAIAFAEEGAHFFDQASGKEKPKAKEDKHSLLIEFMKNLGRQTIIERIQMRVTGFLYDVVEEGALDNNEIIATLATEYLTTNVVLENLHHLFQSNKIEHDRLNHGTVKTILQFVKLHQKGIIKTTKKGKNETKREPEENIDAIADKFITTLKSTQVVQLQFVAKAGLDDPLKYVCFHCLKGKSKILKTCPRCQMISFCSPQCNKLNLKLKTLHGCNISFYDMTDDQINGITKGLHLRELIQVAKEGCAARWQKTRETKLVQEELKLLEMWRADTYGTKFIKMKPCLGSAIGSKGTTQKLNMEVLKGILERNFQKCPAEPSLYSLENILLKLQGIRKSEVLFRTRQSFSTRRSTGGSTLPSSIFYESDAELDQHQRACPCSRMCSGKAKNKSIKKKKQEVDKKAPIHHFMHHVTHHRPSKLQNLVGNHPIKEKPSPVIQKLKKVPVRYQKFIEALGAYFPEIDVSFWLLPYACYSDGQLYYKFCDDDLFKESYSLS